MGVNSALSASERDTTETRQKEKVDQRVYDAVGSQRALISRQDAALAVHAAGLDAREAAVRGSEARLRQQVAQWRQLMEACTISIAAADAKRAVLIAAKQLEEERAASQQWQLRAEASTTRLPCGILFLGEDYLACTTLPRQGEHTAPFPCGYLFPGGGGGARGSARAARSRRGPI